MFDNLQVFRPEEVLKGKRVAVFGAAASALEEENGAYIDEFDVVVRVNKALHTWRPEQQKFIGQKTDVLFHSFFENESSGGGPINLEHYGKFGLQYLVQPLNSWKGLRAQLNFYKRHLQPVESYVLSKENYRAMKKDFGEWLPTTGFAALHSVLTSPCSEIYISGFTFFKTPYVQGYRDHLLKDEANKAHIKEQGLHNPELEFELFKQLMGRTSCAKVTCDAALSGLISEGA